MGSDWNFGGGSSSGGSDWSFGPTHHKKKSGGGGESTFLGNLFGGIEHKVEGAVQASHIGDAFHAMDWAENGAKNLAEQFVLGTYGLGKYAATDVYHHPGSLTTLGAAPVTANILSILEGHGGGELTKKFAEPTAAFYKQKYAPIVEHPLTGSSYQGVRKDPFGTLLDAVSLGTIPFGGEGVAIKGATLADRLGMADTAFGRAIAKAAVAAHEARAPRLVEYTPNEGEGGSFLAPRARTLQGRKVYNPVREAVGKSFEGKLPVVGNSARFAKFARQMSQINLGQDYALLREFDHAIGANIRSSKRLTNAEKLALDILPGYGPETARAADIGVPRQQIMDFYERQKAKALQVVRDPGLTRRQRTTAHIQLRAIERKLSQYKKYGPEIDQAIKEPRPVMQEVTAKAKSLAEEMGRWMVEADVATPEAIKERPLLEQKLLSGAEYKPAETIGYTQEQPNYQIAKSEYDAAINSDIPLDANGVADPAGQVEWIDKVKRAQTALKEARTTPGKKVPIVKEAGFYGGDIPFDQIPLQHPDAFYRPHMGPEPAGGGAGSGRGIVPTTPGTAKLNKGHRFSTGELESGPQVYTRAGLHILRFRSMRATLEQYRGVMVPYDGIPGSHPLRDGYGLVNIDKNASDLANGVIRAARTTRGQKELAGLDENLFNLTDAAEHQQLKDALDQLFPAEHRDLTVAQYQMPLRDIRKIKGDYKRSNIVVRNLVDKPLAVWKALVLKNRPAWLINNLFGQHVLLLLHNGLNWSNYVQALSPKKRQEMEAAIPGLLMQGTSQLARESGRLGTRRARMLEGHYGKTARILAHTGRISGKVVGAWGNAIAKANQELADNVPRTALAIKYAKEQKTMLRHLEIAQGALESAVKGKSVEEAAAALSAEQKAEILGKVDRFLGDFTTAHSTSARNVRRILPFATWFRVILKITADLSLDHPEKLAFYQNLESAVAKDPQIDPQIPLPSWFNGSMLAPWVPGPSAPGTTPVVSTTAINPFQTPVQLAQQLSSLFKAGVPSASDNPVASLGPLISAINLAQGVDAFQGGAYTGPGANQSPLVRALAGTIYGLPQTRLLQAGHVAPYYQEPKSYHDTYVNVNGHQVPLDAILRYLGYPIRRVDTKAAKQYAKEGR